MRSLRERWRSDRPQVLVLIGAVLAVSGNIAGLVYDVLESLAFASLGAWSAIGVASLLALAAGLFNLRTPKSFLAVGLAASAVAFLAWPGVPGATVAVVGAIWGLLASRERLRAPA